MKYFNRLLITSLILFFTAACGGGSSIVEPIEAFKAPNNTQPLQK